MSFKLQLYVQFQCYFSTTLSDVKLPLLTQPQTLTPTHSTLYLTRRHQTPYLSSYSPRPLLTGPHMLPLAAHLLTPSLAVPLPHLITTTCSLLTLALLTLALPGDNSHADHSLTTPPSSSTSDTGISYAELQQRNRDAYASRTATAVPRPQPQAPPTSDQYLNTREQRTPPTTQSLCPTFIYIWNIIMINEILIYLWTYLIDIKLYTIYILYNILQI